MDVTSLYSTIDHHLGLRCLKSVLSKDPEIPDPQRQFLVKCLEFILTTNHFIYGEDTYKQRRGTAMGTRVAPAHADLFMGAFEKSPIQENELFKDKILIYRRFIDELSLIWKGDQEGELSFVSSLNKNTWGIKFTPKFDHKEIEFLDIPVSQNNGSIDTSTYFKMGDVNSYLNFGSHPHRERTPLVAK